MKKVLFNGFHKIEEVESVIKGERVLREKLVLKHAVAGIVVDENDKVGLVTQYRPLVGQMTKEIPAGVLDKEGLTPIEILLEELEEECEIPMSDVISISDEPVISYFMLEGNSNAKISIYEVTVKAQKDKTVSDVDVESVEWVDLETMDQLIKSGHIVDSKTMMTYHHLKNKTLI